MTNLLAEFRSTIAVTILVALLAFAGYEFWQLHRAKAELANYILIRQTEKRKAAEALAAAVEDKRRTEQDLTIKIATAQETSDAKIVGLTRLRDDLSARLRVVRASRSASGGAPSSAAPSPQASGRSDDPVVLGEVGTADVDEAYRADVIRVDLLKCYDSYDAARDTLSK